ncbi:N-acetyl-D-Glu racemase DgcA [Kordiimonas aquimaris]|uniref:N-acetyl-D-Glu racemase DgcA n=1 Tax=Kordiimonas aquimaris TaxID=707591 RepID=UPI0021D2DACC|nr:N-acetyl-D-Glu racemase DgcA [Kordiimonas aquimaris]
MNVTTTIETWPLHKPFRISRRECNSVETLMVCLSKNGITGRGEASGINYKGETVATMKRDIEHFFSTPISNLTRSALLELMPPGGARCALDCALWDLEAKTNGTHVFVDRKPNIQTAFTLSLDTPEKMAANAIAAANQPVLKLKLGGTHAIECVRAVRAARPDAKIIVDANEALSFDDLKIVAPLLHNAGVALIEQPLSRDADAALIGYKSPVLLCADESCMTRHDLPNLIGRYGAINIKLEKTGGLTEALLLAEDAQIHGFELMVGCMLGTSLAMAPAMLIAAQCSFVDLDGPLLLAQDRAYGISYDEGNMDYPHPTLWG